MKITFSDNYDYPDSVGIYFGKSFVRLTFYPVRCWTWEWSLDWAKSLTMPIRASLLIETPTMTIYAMTHPKLNTHA